MVTILSVKINPNPGSPYNQKSKTYLQVSNRVLYFSELMIPSERTSDSFLTVMRAGCEAGQEKSNLGIWFNSTEQQRNETRHVPFMSLTMISNVRNILQMRQHRRGKQKSPCICQQNLSKVGCLLGYGISKGTYVSLYIHLYFQKNNCFTLYMSYI